MSLDKRCLGWHCNRARECALYLRPSVPGEIVFQAYPAGDACDHLQERNPQDVAWGMGHDEAND